VSTMEYISPRGGRSVALDEVQADLATLLRQSRPEMPVRDATIMAYWLASDDPAGDVLVDLNEILLSPEELAQALGNVTMTHAARMARDRTNNLLHPVIEKGQSPHTKRLYLVSSVRTWVKWRASGELDRRKSARRLSSTARSLAASVRRSIGEE
jgi:hypothetical protein